MKASFSLLTSLVSSVTINNPTGNWLRFSSGTYPFVNDLGRKCVFYKGHDCQWKISVFIKNRNFCFRKLFQVT